WAGLDSRRCSLACCACSRALPAMRPAMPWSAAMARPGVPSTSTAAATCNTLRIPVFMASPHRIAAPFETGGHGAPVFGCLTFMAAVAALVIARLHAARLLLPRARNRGTHHGTGHRSHHGSLERVARPGRHRADGRTHGGAGADGLSGGGCRHHRRAGLAWTDAARRIEAGLVHRPQVAVVAVPVLTFRALTLHGIEIDPGQV